MSICIRNFSEGLYIFLGISWYWIYWKVFHC